MEGTLKDYNRTLPMGLRIKLVTMEKFRNIHFTDKCTTVDEVVARIVAVDKTEEGYKAYFLNGNTFSVFYNGYTQKNNDKPKRNKSNGRVRVNNVGGYNCNSSMSPEKFIGICDCFLKNEMPISFKKLTVNVMDGSGNDDTAEELGIPYNIHEDNLEWTSQDRNLSYHGRCIKRIYKKIDKVYRFSANDTHVFDALATDNDKWLEHYLMMHYRRVK